MSNTNIFLNNIHLNWMMKSIASSPIVQQLHKIPKGDKIVFGAFSSTLLAYCLYSVYTTDELSRLKRDGQSMIDEMHSYLNNGPIHNAPQMILEDFRLLSASMNNRSLVRQLATRSNIIKLCEIIHVSYRTMSLMTASGYPLTEIQADEYFNTILTESRVSDAFGILEQIILEVEITKNIPIAEMVSIFRIITCYPIVIRMAYMFASLVVSRPETIPRIMSCNICNVFFMLLNDEVDNEYMEIRMAVYKIVSCYSVKEIKINSQNPDFERFLLDHKKQSWKRFIPIGLMNGPSYYVIDGAMKVVGLFRGWLSLPEFTFQVLSVVIRDGIFESFSTHALLQNLDSTFAFAIGQWVISVTTLLSIHHAFRCNKKALCILMISNFLGSGIEYLTASVSINPYLSGSLYKEFRNSLIQPQKEIPIIGR